MLRVEKLCKAFNQRNGTRFLAIREVSFAVGQGEFLSIVGPSGCGKTTLLMNLAGLMEPTEGRVLLDGREVRKPPPQIVLVFQDYTRSLLPWRTVLRNVSYGLELQRQRVLAGDQVARAEEHLEVVGLRDFRNFYPWQLSGGMQQRVAIARALACEPRILLMDEPFGSLDAQTRADLEDSLLGLWSKFKQTILFVTHDIDEAVYLSDRVLVLSGRPSVVLDEFPIELERPRDQLRTRSDRKFLEYRERIYLTIRQPAKSE